MIPEISERFGHRRSFLLLFTGKAMTDVVLCNPCFLRFYLKRLFLFESTMGLVDNCKLFYKKSVVLFEV
jgi:hypothetical protein